MSAGRSAPGTGGAEPSTRPWRDRLDDPDEPLFTMAIAADLLGVEAQVLRRLGETVDHEGARPSGNQRRYSRHDLEHLGRAVELAAEGHSGQGLARILELERHVALLTAGQTTSR